MHGLVRHHGVGEAAGEPVARCFAAACGSVVDDPEHCLPAPPRTHRPTPGQGGLVDGRPGGPRECLNGFGRRKDHVMSGAMRPRTLIVLLLAGVLASAALSGTASAGPVPTGTAALTKNPMYKTGKFAVGGCEEPFAGSADVEVFRRYVEEMDVCLDKAWQPLLRKAGLPYGKPHVRFSYGDKVKTSCGTFMVNNSDSVYCVRTKTIHMMVNDYGLRGEIDKPKLLESLSIGYAFHVQKLAGILDAQVKLVEKSSKREAAALGNKVGLQALCLSGALTGGVWDSLVHTREHGQDYYIGRHVIGEFGSFGKPANQVYWFRRGFEAESPSVCNTFTAPASRVK
ncbi:hypothetical protein ACQEVF_50900 [Nonomuraea polychroma]|uniref:hypothetical protein n=1 Tax=Nonomuraea polychroma TaxID=46176 RepID=UPI003D8BA45B